MGKAGGIIGIIAGVFGIIAAVVTLFVGGLGSAFHAEGAKAVVGLGWGGVLFSFLAIVFGAVAIARPKGAGIGLIIVSIIGAILGGTLVAICMALSLIGGILAVVGAKNVKPASAPLAVDETTAPAGAYPKKKSVWVWVLASVVVVVIGLVVIAGQGAGKPKADLLTELDNAQPSALRPEGELSELFVLGSKNTDLQRENKLKEIKGQIVQWQLPVYEVARSGDSYKVQTKAGVRIGQFGRNLVGAFIYITPRNDVERQTIEALKTGDLILFKGRIAGSSMRSLEMKPAILASQAASVQQFQQVSPPPANILSFVGKDSESALDEPALKEKFKILLGDRLGMFRERLGVSSGMTQEGDWIVGEGGMQHLFSIEEAAFAINSKTGDIFAIMLTEGKEIRYFGATEAANLPVPLQNWYKAHGGS
jgi:hypothetical protein